MRSCFAILVLAIGLVCLARPVPAQFSTTPMFPSFTEQGVSGSRIGVALRDIDSDRASALKLGSVSGVEVMGVEPGSPAEQAGIKAGDVLLSYNGESIIGAQQLGRLVSETPIGRKVKIEYWRDGKATPATVITAARQQISGLMFNPDVASWQGGVGGNNELLQPTSYPTPRFVWTNQRFGIVCETLDSHEAQLADFFGVRHGVLIRSVVKDSPAAKAGIRAGDVVTQIGDHAVADPKDIASYIRQERHQPKPFALEVMRDHKSTSLQVNPQEPKE